MYQEVTALFAQISLDKRSRSPIYLQISFAVMNYIRNGRLRRGLKLPGVRSLATALRVHRRTLQLALDELYAQGWIEIIPRQGTFVSKSLPELKPKGMTIPVVQQYPNVTNFKLKETRSRFAESNFQLNNHLIMSEGFPDIRLAPMNHFLRELRSIEKRPAFRKYFHYGDPRGTLHLRKILADYLNESRSLAITADNVLITRGAQMGLYLASRVVLQPGDEVIVGEPGYVIADLTLQNAGGVLNKIRVDEEGIDVDAIEALCKKKKIRLVYVIPHHHQPTSVTLTPERRVRLLNLSARYNFAIIEDDYDYDFHYSSSPVVPMASLDHNGNVIYVGTLSKTLVPAVRIGFVVAPANFIKEAVTIRRLVDLQGDSMTEIAIAELYKNGLIQNHIKKMNKIYKERRDNLCRLLKEELGKYVSFTIPDGGLGVWTKFKGVDMAKLSVLAAKEKLLFYDGTIFNTKHSFNFTRLGFSSLDLAEQERAVNILKGCVKKAKLSKY